MCSPHKKFHAGEQNTKSSLVVFIRTKRALYSKRKRKRYLVFVTLAKATVMNELLNSVSVMNLRTTIKSCKYKKTLLSKKLNKFSTNPKCRWAEMKGLFSYHAGGLCVMWPAPFRLQVFFQMHPCMLGKIQNILEFPPFPPNFERHLSELMPVSRSLKITAAKWNREK